MGYFDLNIPYPEPSPAGKATLERNRTKIVVKAMELGYTGIAYNRTIKGVMSDLHRCCIPLLTVSSLLKVAPSLSLSVRLHRDLLGIPSTAPFRQYTRLTVCVDNSSQAQALNSGNPILKTYDLVAVRPLNQTAFDQACERMEVDIISINFSEKLPFRLKQPMVKVAAERGVFFEVTYSGLVTDIQIRRQLISNVKLLVDWTRGRSIILSSAAPSVNELRGPNDVANLSLLLGHSKERAKAAISKNCRTLVANALRKKKYFKEAIRVEVISSDALPHSKEAWYKELIKWDPISSGEGDMLLEDMAKSFSASCKTSKTTKAINFTSVIDSSPSHGFQVKDFLSATASNYVPLSPDNNENFPPITEKVNQSTGMFTNLTEQPNMLDFCPGPDEGLSDAPTTHQVASCDNVTMINYTSQSSEAFSFSEKLKTPTSDTKLTLLETNAHDLQSNHCISSSALDGVISDDNEKLHASSADTKLENTHNIDDKANVFTPSMENNIPNLAYENHKNDKSTDVNLNAQFAKMHETSPKEDRKLGEHTVMETNKSIFKNLKVDEPFSKHETDGVELGELLQKTPHEMKTEDEASIITHLSTDVMMEDQKHAEVPIDSDRHSLVQSISGRPRMKRRATGQMLFPFKRLLSPMPSKKAQKIKSRTKMI